MVQEKTFEIQADSAELTTFREGLRDFLSGAGFDDKRSGEVVLAVDEALTNIIRHAYTDKSGKIQVQLSNYEDRIDIFIQDFGKKFDPQTVPDPELPPKKPGGLGVYLIKTLMDKMHYEWVQGSGNRLSLSKFKTKTEEEN